jgi:putative NIF3 family GTP cyclohydrolase 1 type 2
MGKQLYKRRDFIGNVVKAGAAGVMASPMLSHFTLMENLTVSQVIDRIIAEVPGGKLTETVDTLKSGSGDQVVTGIVTTMFATVKVIQAAAKMKANFIIAHEPTFYNHTDDPNWVENNITVKEKKELLDKYQITVWRFHDYWHRMKPDGILQGFLLKTDWLNYNPKAENVFQVPAQPLIEIVRHIKDSLKIPRIRYIGDETANCSIIALMPGAGGGQRQVKMMIDNKADLLIVGESPEWETPEYIRDSRALGKSVSLIILGHAYSEEPGMEYLVQWLQPKLHGIKITHIAPEATFTWA